jgi:anhydro-N-acetylmuramic acid kinase
LADKLLFGTWDAALNLGGFANVSLDDANGQRVAWDVGPANLLLNHLVKPLGMDMDRDGALAAEGRVDANLLKSWQSLSYHEMAPPKSLGREWLEKEVIPVLASYAHLPVQDVLATAVAYIADMVVQELPAGMGVLVTGGGAFNGTLMEALRQKGKAKRLSWHLPDPSMIHGKEAYVFAWLGLLRWLGMTNTLASVTGAQKASAGGALWGPGPHEVDRSA